MPLVHKRNNTKNTVQTIQNTINTSMHITKTPAHYITTHTYTHISSTVQCYDIWDFQSGVVERFRRKYILQRVTAELQTANLAYFQRKIQLS
jgi:hypothetical protein